MSPRRAAPVIALIGLVLLAALYIASQRRPQPPSIGRVPDFTLTSQDGRPFGSADLAGRPYVTSFFFTTCTTVCPRLMGQVAKLQQRLAAEGLDVRLVSITVDPENDTPPVLRAYGETLGADFGRWTFLTGAPDEVRRVIERGFVTAMGEKTKDPSGVVDIGHGTHLMLVDRAGVLVDRFPITEEGLDALLERARQLAGGG
jgi:protein SCO1/2